MNTQSSLNFRTNAVKAIANEALRASMRNAADTFGARRLNAITSVPDFEELREKASAIRMDVLNNIKTFVERFTANAANVGAVVHHAADAGAARMIIANVLKEYWPDVKRRMTRKNAAVKQTP